MFWRNKATTKLNSVDHAAALISALQNYSLHFSSQLKSTPDNDLLKARSLVRDAERVIREAGIADALSVLIAETWQWPAWSKRDDFENHINFPAKKVVGKEYSSNNCSGRDVEFTFEKFRWKLNLMKDGPGYSYSSCFASVTVSYQGKVVLGARLTQDIGREYFDWEFVSVEAFAVGDWMKTIIEIATMISHNRLERLSKFDNDRVMRASRNIRLK